MNAIQQCILSIFKEVSKICVEHSIPYYAIGGSCLGAVRHNGFIPWDDDLDIAIPIEYFSFFIEIARTRLPDHLYLLSANDVHHYHYVWCKVCDRRTSFIEQSEYKYSDAYKGVFIDIMPISGVPSNEHEREHFIKKLKRLEWLNDLRRFPLSASSCMTRIVKYPIWLIVRLFKFNLFSSRYIRFLSLYPMASSSLTGYTWSPSCLPKLVFPREWFGLGEFLDFEDTMINCPIDYRAYLSQQFGDYMQLPPIDKRMIHNGFVDLEKSFLEYRKNGLPKL